jgi:tetratricopeptide (TPR) repeat protein
VPSFSGQHRSGAADARRAGVAVLFVCACVLARRAEAHGDLHARIEAISAQILTNQASSALWLQRADLNRQHGALDAAREDLNHAIRLRPDFAAVHLQRARIDFAAAQFPECVHAATECLAMEPSNADALVLRARAQVQLGEPACAIADYDDVLNATNAAAVLPDLYLERARALAGMKRWDDAIHGLDEGMKQLGATPSLAFPAIEYERARGAYDAALSRLERARGFFSEASYGRLRAEISRQKEAP